ncbi:hypothetical protein COW36_05005 [bacterium (Candidatus Blackallbacteria) CG17_big_fil_post_rev_8_21_14_2_50_48_46]|uniref:8-oxo-dGTP diphosphatase n=1 Tax=bacterium (Candidatus Blackallbacteria) CG17_big_fil_post_rev_8_21_14_2_50_48_46 TaxID=2014261 RepID=A0A2M7G976_9BACT|nr:MAG: hypothetical protein COW64_03940 [bacterium (Candidatus Blackallbacteria) CG18_big_fil_WC_8_21_14_2_50_49_26]PIW18655.1 MAG: hypothetical protein COW36_05005 [bacterium (Candidatus Blackallbacteria) CG17_big_fil_post_rev_8_21_14_2_50_48_46]PIW46359.1 MAG: hypothetical protein COW20_15675 [bacterium (Candidatus Blackallbacteria) CG13_big_fil_rev_8_21_14_2_50_49_14]
MKTLRVSCAVLRASGKILAAQRSAQMSHAGQWEFPGGKIEAGESPEAALIREIREELGIEIEIESALPVVEHMYPERQVQLFPFVSRLLSGRLQPHEHSELRWCQPDELKSLDWLEADIPVVEWVLKSLSQGE